MYGRFIRSIHSNEEDEEPEGDYQHTLHLSADTHPFIYIQKSNDMHCANFREIGIQIIVTKLGLLCCEKEKMNSFPKNENIFQIALHVVVRLWCVL